MRLAASTHLLSIVCFATVALGCAAPFSHLPKDQWTTAAEPGKAYVCILYAGSGWGGTFAYLFLEDSSGEDRYVGTLFNKTHLTMQLDPGTYMVAVVGESVDLMRMQIEAGQTYHAIVASYMAPTMAMRNSYGHYRIEAINDPNDPDLPKWIAESSEVVPTEKGQAEGAAHLKRLAKMKPEYRRRWEAKEDKQFLHVPTPHTTVAPDVSN